MGEWLLSRRDRLIVARHFVPGLEFGRSETGRLPDGPYVRHVAEPRIGVGRANAPPPSEPDWQFSSIRLSS